MTGSATDNAGNYGRSSHGRYSDPQMDAAIKLALAVRAAR